MNHWIGQLVGQFSGVTVNALLMAGVLTWRARVGMNWNLRYQTALWVGLKAAWVAFAAVVAVAVGLKMAGISGHVVNSTGPLVWLVTWWFVHANGLFMLSSDARVITLKEARALSASVFAYWFGILFGGALVVVLLLVLLHKLTG